MFVPRATEDDRGVFVKSFHETLFASQGIHFTTREEFYSTSKKDVLRGMHFQKPPHDHAKLVTCLRGRIQDVLLDLRKNQPTFGHSWAVELSEQNHQVLYIPAGLAHGFIALDGEALVHYKTTSVHNPENDVGILWDSFDFTWPVKHPILSKRDLSFPRWRETESPF